MVEKKIATIAILCVATVLFLGLWSSSAQEARTLNSKYVKVVEDYNRLTSDYWNLEAEKASLEKDYSKLTSDYSNLEAEKASLEKDYSKLKTEKAKLETDYSSLLAILNIVNDPNNPNNKVTTFKDLIVKFAVDRTVYDYTDEITGTAEIYYMDGTPFRGYFLIEVRGWNLANPGSWTDVYGKTSWGMHYPNFRDGPGTYKIAMLHLTTWNEREIESGIIEGTEIQLEVK